MLDQDAGTRIVSESERKIRGFVLRFGNGELINPQQILQSLREEGTFCSLSEIEGVLESIRQEQFAQLVEDGNLVPSNPPAELAEQKAASRKEPIMADTLTRSERAQGKKDFAIKNWRKNPEIPKNTMRAMILEEFGKSTDWNTLSECRKIALSELKNGTKTKVAKNGSESSKVKSKAKAKAAAKKIKTSKKKRGPGRPKGSKNKIQKPKKQRTFYRNSNALDKALSMLKGIENIEGLKVNVSLTFE